MEFRLPGVPPADLVDLYEKRALSDREYQLAIEWATKPPARDRWAGYLRDWFLIFGVLLLVSGVIVFGAYNWQALHRFHKLGLLQLLILGAWTGSRLRPADSTEAQGLLWGASLLVGALLAVVGQVYQSGADAYTLFLGWSLLITPWCLAGRSNLLWLTQAVLINVTFTLYWGQVVSEDFAAYSLAYAALNGMLAALWAAARRRYDWMSSGLTDALLANALIPLTASGCLAFWEGQLYSACLLVCLGLLALLVWRLADQVSTMAVVAFSAVFLGGAAMIRVLADFDELGFLLIAVGLVLEVTLAASWLKRINAQSPPPTQQPSKPEASRPNLIEVLAQNGLLEESPPPAERQVTRATPKYVSFLSAVGAWISSWFFLAFLAAAVSDSDRSMIAVGVVLWAFTIVGRRVMTSGSEFLAHLCLAVNMAGQLMALIGVGVSTGWDTQSLAGSALLLQLVGLVWFKDGLGRCLFAFASVLSGGIFFWSAGGSQGLSVWLLLIAFMVSRLLIGQRGWLLSRWRYWHGGVAFGWSCGLLTAISFWGLRLHWSEWGVPDPWLLATGLTVLVAACAIRLQAPLSAVMALVVLGAATFTMPGLMAAMLVFILAFHTRSLGASWLSILGLLVFGVLYYYNLDLSFLAKSVTLIGSGLLLLMARSTLRGQPVRHAF
jgi:hypothetical protein